MRKPDSLRHSVFTAMFGLALVAGCFSATPSRTPKDDASHVGDASDGQRSQDIGPKSDGSSVTEPTNRIDSGPNGQPDTGPLTPDAAPPVPDGTATEPDIAVALTDAPATDALPADAPPDSRPGSIDAVLDIPVPDAPSDSPPSPPLIDASQRDLPAESSRDVVPDLPLPPTDTGQACGGGCCTNADCPVCNSCSANHACVPVLNADDPAGRCAGICDATGTCKSRKGQTCQKVPSGCASGTTCAPDGICCNVECNSPCMACDIPGFEGTCTPVASGKPHGNRASCGTDATCAGTCTGRSDGQCSFESKACGAAATCSGTDKEQPQSICVNGACQAQAPQTCTHGFACAAGSCKTTCTTSADCQSGYNCIGQKCTTHKFRGGPCVITPDVTGAATSVYVQGDDGHIYYGSYSPGGQLSWTIVAGLDGAAIASNSDLDCASDGYAATVQMVARGGMPLGAVLHATGTGSAFSSFSNLVLGVGLSATQDPSVMGNGELGLAFVRLVSGGTPLNTMTFNQYDSTWGITTSSYSATSLTKVFASGIDAETVGGGYGTRGFVGFMADGTMGETLMMSIQGTTRWDERYFSPPAGTTFQYSPSMCTDHNPRASSEGNMNFVVTAGDRLWYSHYDQGGFTSWQKVSDVPVASAPDCVINSDNGDSSPIQLNIVALTPAGALVHVHGPVGGAFSAIDLGVYP